MTEDIVERVARAIWGDSRPDWPYASTFQRHGSLRAAKAALEASHHAELVEAASKFTSLAHRAGPTTDLYWAACERLEAVLAKIGGDA